MNYRRLRWLASLLPLIGLLVLSALPPAAPATASSSPRIDKSTPYGVAVNLAVNVRDDEQAALVDLLRESGAQWHREEFSWERLQPERTAAYRWSGDGFGFLNYDKSVSRARGAGLNVLGLLAYNPAWFKGKNPPLDDWIGDWQLYVYNVVSRYGRQRKQIKHWEIWNEENLKVYGYENGLYSVEHYGRLLQATQEMIKLADPEATIVLGGLASIWSEVPEHYYDVFDYLDRLGKTGAWSAFDVINIHAYRPGAPEGVFLRRDRMMGLGDEMRELDALMAKYGEKPVWFTEVGWGSHTGPYGISEQEQAYYVVRFYALALAQPRIEKVFWYNFRNNLAYWTPYDQLIFDETVPDWHMGLLRRSYPLKVGDPTLRKPAFLAFRTMTDLLGGLTQEEQVAAGQRADLPSLYWYRYGNAQRRVDLLWQLRDQPATVSVYCGCREARVRRWNGTVEQIARTDTGTIQLVVPGGGEPIYLEYGPDRNVKAGSLYFRETGHSLGGAFLTYWRQRGGLAQFGYPISGEVVEPDPVTGRARIVQYFERNRFEYFPEHAGTPYVVQLGRLGEDQLRDQGVNWQDESVNPQTPRGCRRFVETRRLLCPPFRAYWEQRGGLAIYGLPLTDARIENGRLVQYFERNRFEYHPENAGTPYEVLLGLLGVELFTAGP